MAYRFKTRSTTPGQYRLAPTTLSQLIALGDIENGVGRGDGGMGTFTSPAVGKVISDTSWGAGGTEFTGTYHPTLVGEVLSTVSFGASSAETGTYIAPVQAGYSALAAGYGAGGATTGTLAASKIRDVTYGTLGDGSVLVAAGGTYVDPADSAVWHGVAVGVSPRAGTKVGSSITNLSVGNVKDGVAIDDVTGTYSPGGTYAAGQTAQHVTDAAFLETNKDEIVTTDTAIFAEFGVTGLAIEGGGGTVVIDTEGDVYTSA